MSQSIGCCQTCGGPIDENSRIMLRGALIYHAHCEPSSAGAPVTIWQALLQLLGLAR